MALYLLTGAAGFIGSNVAAQLIRRGDSVVGVDNLNDAYDVRLKEWRVRQLEGCPGFRFERLDIQDLDAMAGLFERHGRFDAVLNLAARAGVRHSVETPQVYFDTNLSGTLNLLRLCVQNGVSKFVLASTSSLYGGDNPRPFLEDMDTNVPLSPYAASKKAAEVLCATYHYLFGLDVSILRYFTVYGPAGRPDMSLFRFVQWIREGRPLQLYGDGTQERDFTYVEDVARATIAALKPLGYEIINVGSDRPVVLADVIRMIEELTGRCAAIESGPSHRADVRATWAHIGKAGALLDWRPQVDVREGIQRLVQWYDDNRAWAADIKTG